ncbi:MAG TPA: adenylate/guanylate cyclase domain-containing protein [Candidatus Competibacter sp.]|nr:adenylate/guanylate cyclase domain-containing protein [Candidatus Competibacter sp.]HRX62670.1 adenylate/guanylate cyclase domain-containing protein [Candidatus Competibacter sp.]
MTRDPHWLPLILPALGIAALVGLLMTHGPLRPLENGLGDLRIALMTPRQPLSDAVVLLTIGEETLSRFACRSPINRSFLADLVTLLNRRGVQAIGLDILFDQPTDPAADHALQQALRSATVPVVVAYAYPENGTALQQSFLETFTAGLQRGAVDLHLDGADGVVRTLFPGRIGPEGRFTPGFAVALAGVTPPDTAIPLHYRGLPPGVALDQPFRAFKRYPAYSAETLPADWLAGKIVLVGMTSQVSDEDRWKTPFTALLGSEQGSLPGLMIHAHALTQLLEGRSLPAPFLWTTWSLYFVAVALGIGLARLNQPAWATLGLAGVLLGGFWVGGFLWYRYGGSLLPLGGPSLTLLGVAGWCHASLSRQAQRQKQFIQGAFGRYLHPAWVQQLIEQPALLRLQGERRELTVLFTDVANFTTFSEVLPPTTLVQVLSRYLEGMTDLIIAHGGSVNKYLGDGIMVLFGAPVAQADHAVRAVRCALALDAFAEAFRRTATDAEGQPVGFGQTRIGVHTGEATVGNFGSSAKLEYTAIGDVVNAAARLEGLNRFFGTRIAVSGATRALVVRAADAGDVGFRPMGEVVVKGKQAALPVFNPLMAKGESAVWVKEYAEAYALLEAGDGRALERLTALRARYPDDALVEFHWRRTQAGELTTRVTLTAK